MSINIIFVLGPSGVGKSDLSKTLAKRLGYEFCEIDQWPKADGINAHGLRDEWDEFCRAANPEPLADLLRSRAQAAGKEGIVLSFPGNLILRGPHLGSLSGKVRVLYLAGREGQCLDAFLAREKQIGRNLDALHWAQNNRAIFEFLRTDEARPHIVLAFDENGRRSTEQVLADVAADSATGPGAAAQAEVAPRASGRLDNMGGESYRREELREAGNGFPDRGPFCEKCQTRIPQFADLRAADEARVRDLIMAGDKVAATKLLASLTGCSPRWAKIWVLHEGRPMPVFPGPPCPRCGKPLRTARARQCPHCKADWH